MIFDQSSSQKFLESKFLISFQFFQLLNTFYTSITKCSFSICQFFLKWELVLVWTVHTLFEYAQFPLLENQINCLFNSQILFSARSALYSCLRISDFASASNWLFFFSLQKWSWSDSCQTLGQICAFCDIHLTGFPVLAKNWLCTLKQAFSLWVISLQQARTCFSLLKVQWWSQRIPGVHVVNLSIWVLRVVVAKVVDCPDIWALEEWSYCLRVFSQFSSWKLLDL